MTSVVYFALDERGRPPHLVKIGRSKSPDIRHKQLQTGNGYDLRLLGWLPGGEAEERKLHEAFAPFRVRGEWFRVWPAAIELIEAVCDEAARVELVGQLEASIKKHASPR